MYSVIIGFSTVAYRKNIVAFQDEVQLYEPLKQEILSGEELAALQSLCNTNGESVFCSERAVIRKEIYHSMIYYRAGNSCSFIVRVEDRDREMIFFGKILKFVIIQEEAVSLMKRLHHHENINICKDSKNPPTNPMLRRLVHDGTLGTHYAAVEEVDDVLAVYCKFITSKCIFIRTDQIQGVDGFITCVMTDYYS